MEGNAADVIVFGKKDFEICEVISGGSRLFKNGKLAFKEAFLKNSNRIINLKGGKA